MNNAKMATMISINEAVKLIDGLSYGVVYRFITSGSFTGYVKAGNHYLINKDMFLSFLRGEQNPIGARTKFINGQMVEIR